MPAADSPSRSRAPQGADPSWLSIDVVFEDDGWKDQEHIEALIGQAAAELAVHEAVRRSGLSQVCIALSSDAHVQDLNASYRGKDKPTNVLSFPAPASPQRQPMSHLGDIIIARETVAREAAEKAIPFADHLQHLTIHGLLHLLGYDHETDGEAVVMEGLERDILGRMGIPDPYADSDANTPDPTR